MTNPAPDKTDKTKGYIRLPSLCDAFSFGLANAIRVCFPVGGLPITNPVSVFSLPFGNSLLYLLGVFCAVRFSSLKDRFSVLEIPLTPASTELFPISPFPLAIFFENVCPRDKLFYRL
jgi:hypothetical protein